MPGAYDRCRDHQRLEAGNSAWPRHRGPGHFRRRGLCRNGIPIPPALNACCCSWIEAFVRIGRGQNDAVGQHYRVLIQLIVAVFEFGRHPLGDRVICIADRDGEDVGPTFSELYEEGRGEVDRAALLVDAREGEQIEKLPGIYRKLALEHATSLVFVEASDAALQRRFTRDTASPPTRPGAVPSSRESVKSAAAWLRFAASRTSLSTRRSSMSTSCANLLSTTSRIPGAGRCWYRS